MPVNPSESTSQMINPIVIDKVVHIGALTWHLDLLRRFKALETADEATDLHYLYAAEQRYGIWLHLLKDKTSPAKTPLPPLDVLLMWHAHMLNPWRYHEDTYHIFGREDLPFALPLEEVALLSSEDYVPDRASLDFWDTNTGLPFELRHDKLPDLQYSCAWCSFQKAVSGPEYIQYRTKGAPLKCKQCGEESTVDNASAVRFLRDVREFHLSTEVDPLKTASIIRGCLLNTTTGVIDTKACFEDLKTLFRPTASTAKKVVKSLLELSNDKSCSWSIVAPRLVVLKKTLSNLPRTALRHRTIAMLNCAYQNNVTMFSTDLVAAVKRQRDFTGKMVDGTVIWDAAQMARATVRYHKFLLLMAHEHSFLVPTLDIDLAWHTHQLHPSHYQQYGLKHLRRIINHDDTVSNSHLKNSFAHTARLWKKHFNEIYSCDLPPQRGLLEKLFSAQPPTPYREKSTGFKFIDRFDPKAKDLPRIIICHSFLLPGVRLEALGTPGLQPLRVALVTSTVVTGTTVDLAAEGVAAEDVEVADVEEVEVMADVGEVQVMADVGEVQVMADVVEEDAGVGDVAVGDAGAEVANMR
ncbi:uncharacterized protein SPPG_04403 [Spizellomyces punctatus DAOM BR117]|uniref:Uncharacterized protein n=1 Tax=Spizellomyces punctatus (strain DAOM BR117) TaxID=645134 RepID=A0A0L0HGS8_SPIPD|nr:uncharacterized protein SPPG_04403 [Spizellomyces punctatus DAOM BR117]KND00060.1 hypothetical protein SPPG_04403 [Spizellomyces punctatus DAOM BR117]|eukprot:XP_016608099.1 hypothetical protein SPPG_04403 [Spizellomyces punctatus DAOM BR117]